MSGLFLLPARRDEPAVQVLPLSLVVPFHLSFHLSFVPKVSCARAHLQLQDLLPDQKLVVEFLKNSSEGDSGSPSAASQTSVAD